MFQKPLITVRIADKNEDPLKSAFEEISVADSKLSNSDEKKDQNEKDANSSETLPSNSENEESENVNVSELPIPKTSMQFTSTWDKLNSPESQYLYLKVSLLYTASKFVYLSKIYNFFFLQKIRGEDLPQIFKEALESYIFSEILEILSTEFVKNSQPVYHYLLGFSNVKRIKALLLFASEEDNASKCKILIRLTNVKKRN